MKSTLTETIVSINEVEENRELHLEPYKVYVNAHYIEHDPNNVRASAPKKLLSAENLVMW